MKKTLKILLITAGAMIGLFLLSVLVMNLFFRVKYGAFYAAAQREFRIPGLRDGFTPQGLTLCEDGIFLTCGYMKDGGASRVYRICGEGGYIELLKEDGTPDLNHAGGLAVYGDWLYLTNEENISVYPLDEVLAAPSGGALRPVYHFPVGFGASFVYAEADKLYVGEFYREESYPTDETHHMETDAGDAHYGLIAVYPLSPAKQYGFAAEAPEYVYSIIGLAQGMCVTRSGRICISTSYGTADSHVYLYEDPAWFDADGMFDIARTRVPLYYLDSDHLEETVTLFPMSEELAYLNGRVYVMCESASNKYLFGKFTGNGYVYSFPAT
jgi:hypothetical protein